MAVQQAFQPHWYGDYELLRPLGAGGMAEVFLARTMGAQGFEKIVVLKRMLAKHADQPRFVQMFVDEAKVAVRLQHANIVQILGFDEVDGRPFIVMEYVHGRDLHELLRTAQLSRTEVPVDFGIHCLVEMLKGLGYAHHAAGPDGEPLRLIHRDVTPSNIFISFEGEVKLGDFGVAHSVGQAQGQQMRGKYAYLAPEILRGLELDHRADLFSAGIVLWETLAGRRLFVADSDLGVLDRIRNEVPEPPSTYNPRIPPDLDRITARALERDREKRFQTAQDFEEALSDYLFARRLRWTRRRIADVMQAHFREESKPLVLPPATPREQALPGDDWETVTDPAVRRMKAALGGTHTGPVPVEDPVEDEVAGDVAPAWPDPVEPVAGPIEVTKTFVESAERAHAPLLLGSSTGMRAVDLAGLVAALLDDPGAVQTLSVPGGDPRPLERLGPLLFWDSLVGLREPDEEPELADSFATLSPTRLLYEATLRQTTGLLVLDGREQGGRRLVYLEKGYPLYVASDRPAEGAPAMLLRHQMVGPELLLHAVQLCIERLLPLDRALAEASGEGPGGRADRVISAVVRSRLYPAFGWRDGESRVYTGARPPQALAARLPPLLSLLVRAVRRGLSLEQLQSYLLPRGQLIAALKPDADPYIQALRLRPEELSLVDAIDGRGGLDELLQRAVKPSREARHGALALLYVLYDARLLDLA